jgi:predicted enzyme related to lactoylglutathione lyase
MKRVTGIGGFFFKSKTPKELMAWYKEHLGIDADPYGGWTFEWLEKDHPARVGQTVFNPFKADTDYFAPSNEPYMFNLRVDDLHALIAQLRREGVQVVGEVQDSEYGKFGWVVDPEGRKIELWEPPVEPAK